VERRPREGALQSAVTAVLADHGISEVAATYLFPTFITNHTQLYLMTSADG